jgi:hypothetical protein
MFSYQAVYHSNICQPLEVSLVTLFSLKMHLLVNSAKFYYFFYFHTCLNLDLLHFYNFSMFYGPFYAIHICLCLYLSIHSVF